MTQTYLPFDAGAGANVTEDGWRKMARLWLPSGPILGELNGLEVFADSTGMQVKTKSGRAWVEGHFFESDAQETLAIGAADPTNPRIDRVIVRADFVANTVALAVLAGTPAASPSAPALTQNASKHEISLAQVLVDAAASTIAASKVTDERQTLGRYGGEIIRRKTANKSIASSATLQDDDHLFFAIGANEVWVFEAILLYNASGGSFKFTFTGPSGATGRFQESAALSQNAVTLGTEKAESNGATGLARADGIVVNSSTAGFLRLRWAQDNSNAAATTVETNSLLVARRIA